MRKIWLAFLTALSLTVFVALPASAATNCPQQYQWSNSCPQAQAYQTAQSQASCVTLDGTACNNGVACKVAKLNCGNLQNLNLNDLLAMFCNR